MDEGMLVTLLLLMLEDPVASAGNVIHREALDVVGVRGKVDVEVNVGEEMEDKTYIEKEQQRRRRKSRRR